jgi:lysophospholipase L1-like esterase
MKQVHLFLLALAIALGGCGEKVPTLPRLGPSDVIVAFGDSLTYGTGAAEHESYPAVLEQLTGRKVIGAGVPGEITARGLARLPRVLEQHRPRLVIVCLGGNDLLRKVPQADIKSNLRRIIQLIHDRGAAVALVGVPRPALLSSAPEFYEELAREFKLPYDGKTVKSVLFTADMKSDPIHPNAKGYRVIAEAIVALLKEAGAL